MDDFMDYPLALGIAGASLTLFAFFMEQAHRWKDESVVYDGCNFFGAALLVIYSYLLGSYPFLVLNGVWALISLRDLVRDLRGR